MQLPSLSLFNFTYFFIFLIVIMYCILSILRFSSFMLRPTKLDMSFCEVNIAEQLQLTIYHVTPSGSWLSIFFTLSILIAIASCLYFYFLYIYFFLVIFLLIFNKIFRTEKYIEYWYTVHYIIVVIIVYIVEDITH